MTRRRQPIDERNIVDAATIARRLGRKPTTVYAWTKRYHDFPARLNAEEIATFVWNWPEVDQWYARRRPDG